MRQVAGDGRGGAAAPAGTLRLAGVAERVAVAEVRWRDDELPTPPRRRPPRAITVVIADDQRLLRTGFRVILDAEPDIRSSARPPTAARRSTSCGAGAPTWC